MKHSIIIPGMAIVVLFQFLITFTALAQKQEGWTASPEHVLSSSKSQPDCNFYEEKVPKYFLPEVLATEKGHKINLKKEWQELRRPEILDMFTNQVFGKVPETPWDIKFELVKVDGHAMNNAATLKIIDIIISARNKPIIIHLGLFIPSRAPKPVPAFLFICNRGTENIDFSREKKSEFWPAEEIVARGYAVAAFYNGDVDPDVHDNFKNGIHGLLDTERTDESWGTIAAWAWGASRCMDYLETDHDLAADKVALAGHSRGGKTALWAGATDERFAMIACNEAGCGGSSLARRRFGETIEKINEAFPHWFCGNYKKYGNHENEMPFDNHMLMALIAPRALYIASADEDLWADPHGQYLALYNALPVYRLYDKNTRLDETMPPLNKPVISGHIAYHIRNGVHNLLLKDWNYFMDFADAVLKEP